MAKSKFIDVILRLKDDMSGKLGKTVTKINESQKTLEKYGKKFEKTGGTIQKTGKKLTKGITMPIAGIAVASIKTAADFESGMSNVAAISGATSNELQKLKDKALEMGRKTKFSARESSDAFAEMASAGWDVGDMMNGIEGTMYLAGASGEDLARTAEIVTNTMTAFGMSTDKTNKFVNILTETANKTATDVDKMGETFKYVAPVAGALGYSAEDTATAIGIMSNAGIKASQAGTSLRSVFSRLASPPKAAAEAMEKLGISMTDSNGKMKPFSKLLGEMREKFSGLSKQEKVANANAIAGKNAMSGFLALMNASQSDVDSFSAAINGTTNAIDENSSAMKMYKTANDNLKGRLTVLKSTAESAAISIGNKLSPYIEKLTGIVQKAADWFCNLSDGQLDLIIKFAGVAAAIGPVTIGIGKFVSGIGKGIKTFGNVTKAIGKIPGVLSKVKGAFSKVFSILGSNPKLLLFLAIAAAIAAIAFLIIKNWDKIKPVLIKVGNWFKNLGIKIKDTFISIKEKTVDFVKNLVEKIKTFVANAKAQGGVIGAVFQNISNRVDALKRIFNGVITFVKGVFTGDWKKAWQGVKDIFGGIFANLGAVLKAPLNGVIGLINGAIGQINKIKITVPDWVPKFGGRTFGGNIPTIPYLYKGTDYFKGGSAVIHDKGAEIVDLPRGTRVIPHDRSLKTAYSMGQRSGGRSISIAKLADTIIVREEADIEKLADRLARKMESLDYTDEEDVA